MKRSRLFLVGITGTFGSGKSTVRDLFRRWGARVIDADRLAHEALRKGSEPYRKIIDVFGKAVAKRNGALDRKKLAGIVFSDSVKRKKLERIIHPYVFRRIREKLANLKSGIVAIEVPLLFETGFRRQVDRTVAVHSSKQKILSRLSRTRHLEKSDIEARTAAQMPLPEKIKRSDFVINNTNGPKQTLRQTKRIWAEIKREVK